MADAAYGGGLGSGYGSQTGSQTGESSGAKGDQDTDTSPQGMMTGVVDSQGNVVGFGPTNAFGNPIGTVMGTNVNAPDFGGLERAGLQDISRFGAQYGTQQPGLSPTNTGFNLGLPSLGQISQFGTDVNKFAFDPTLGIVSLATGFPIGAVLGLANAFGLEMGPPAPEDKSETRGREPVDTPLTVEQVDPFAGDAVKSKRYKDFMLAGYPPDMAEYLVNQLM